MVINKTKKLLSFILSVMIMFSAILPISAVYAETGENIANLSGPTEVCRGTNVRISVLADIVKGAQGAQIDFSYSENCPKTTVTIDEEKTTVWPKGQKGANSKMILATTGMGDEDAGGKIVGYIDFKVPEDAALGTEYKISIDSFEVSGPNGVMESETESVIIIVCVVDLPSIEGISAEDYNGTYDGKPHTAKVNIPNGASVKFGETQGNYDLDEPLSYINAGYYDIFYRVEKEGFKPYEGMAKVNIGKKALEDKMLAEISDKTYTGEKIQPEISLTDAAPCIISENDYVVEYGDNVNVKEGGTLKIKAAENGNYSGEISRSFKILPAEMEFSAKDYDGIYDGKTHGAELKITKPASAKVKFGVKDGEFNLDSMPEYKDAGEYTVFYSAEDDNYNPKKGSLKVKISPKTLDGTMIAEIPPMDFTGSALKPRITVIDQNPSIISEEDYSISYGENINVPSGTVKITGKKNYKGEAEKSFAINPVDMNVVPGDYKGTYDGAEHTGKVEVAEPSVYEIRYSTDGINYNLTELPKFKNAGEYTVYYKITAKNYKENSGMIYVRIYKKDLETSMFKPVEAQKYTGSQIKPDITVADGTPSIITADDYNVIYGENVAVGKESGKITVKATENGNYTGEIYRCFEIAPETMEFEKSDYNGIYDGKPHKASLRVIKPANANIKYGLTEGEYNLSEMPEFTDAGSHTVYFFAEDRNFADLKGSVSVNISRKTITEEMIENPADFEYSGEQIKPVIRVSDGGKILDNTEVSFEYGENKNVLTGGTVIIKGAGNYDGEILKTFKITKKALRVSTPSKEITYGDNVDFEIIIEGFAANENKEVLKNQPVVINAKSKYDAGEYAIALGGADADNYSFEYDNSSVLRVLKKQIELTALKVFDKAADGSAKAVIIESSAVLNGVLSGDSVFIDIQNAAAEFVSAEVAENVEVNISGLAIKGESSGNYVLAETGFKTYANIKENISAEDIAKSITSVIVDKYEKMLKLPEVPDGYSIKLKSTSDEDVISADGKITLNTAEKTVVLVFTVESADGEDAYETEEITATVPAAEKFSVNLTVAAGSGTVSGAGEYFKYDDAVLTASPNGNASFIGWYAGDELVSDAAVYTVKVTENINLFAKFTEETSHRGGGGRGGSSKGNTVYIKFSADGVKLDDIQVAKNTSVSSLPVPEREGYIFDGWFTDKELTKPFDENAKITAATTLYAKWSEKKAEDAEDKKDENKETGKQIILLTINSKEADVFGEKIQNDVAPVIKNGRTMLPVRFIAEALGAKVEWNGAEQKVTVKKENLEIIIFIGSDKAYVNNEENILDSAAYIENDRTMLPVRFISEKLGAKVEWNEALSQVIITKIN